MPRALAIDMSRLWLASLKPVPRGIERVDLALARELCENWTGDLFGVSWTPWGLRMVERELLAALVNQVARAWREQSAPKDDPAFVKVSRWLEGDDRFEPEPMARPVAHHVRKGMRGWRALTQVGISLGRPAERLPKDAILASFGHVGLALPAMRGLLRARQDILLAAMIHDVVSITDPQFFPERNAAYFRGVFDAALRPGSLVLTTTACVRAEVEGLARQREAAVEVRTVDISGAFRDLPPPAEHSPRTIPYFVVCGTREPRKNHLLLLNVWRTLASIGGAPKLLLVGGHGWGTDLVNGMLARAEPLQGLVAPVANLGSPGLFRLLGQARALLAPSFAEGYGLPVEEALTLGTPVVAADSAAFRETTRGLATLLDPLDGPGWRAHIAELAACPAPDAQARLALAHAFRNAAPGHPGIVSVLAAL